MLEEVRAAAEAQAASRKALEQATSELHDAIRAAKQQGVSESELAAAAGVTRQRVWQVTRS